ncbi:hypothetical protein HMPREF1129_1615 [Actinomyces naeslundii str. Howell 279]|uniref:Uncharacterized protein n=1 Tax=Actinomyces naeslundii (strain ATCC 12104 / DSM 43013 / CCUG 2238 / JCM 8349 / NCTC 10301 / Howell 279) TaxID=1115803 RepID=J2ZST7_ACTNH|nr:hypothetical protein HMPREF1129_1615 [Actinomyces naeslundii str. Howell 279]
MPGASTRTELAEPLRGEADDESQEGLVGPLGTARRWLMTAPVR